jgi:hypothetical protein
MQAAADILRKYGLSLRSAAPGRYYTLCPKCSAERSGFCLHDIHRALLSNRSATIVALVLRRTACLRAILQEARS